MWSVRLVKHKLIVPSREEKVWERWEETESENEERERVNFIFSAKIQICRLAWHSALHLATFILMQSLSISLELVLWWGEADGGKERLKDRRNGESWKNAFCVYMYVVFFFLCLMFAVSVFVLCFFVCVCVFTSIVCLYAYFFLFILSMFLLPCMCSPPQLHVRGHIYLIYNWVKNITYLSVYKSLLYNVKSLLQHTIFY